MKTSPAVVIVSDVLCDPNAIDQYSVRLCRDDGTEVVEVPLREITLSIAVNVALSAHDVPSEKLDGQSCGRLKWLRRGLVIYEGSAGPSEELAAAQSSGLSVSVPLVMLTDPVKYKVMQQIGGMLGIRPQPRPSWLSRLFYRLWGK